jgi:DNA-binding NarL/FixJ family response regulator/N-acetylneuraminic acid mutarotase
MNERPSLRSPQKYLLVDDHAAFRQTVRDFLPAANIEVTECGDGFEALRAFAAHKPDWTLIDIEMPRMDGLAATRAIVREFPGARVVIVSQHDTPELREEAREAGACGYVLKGNLAALRILIDLESGARGSASAAQSGANDPNSEAPISPAKRTGRERILCLVFAVAALVLACTHEVLAVPLEIHYQGLVSVNGAPFNGTGRFKFALRNGPSAGAQTLWTHDGSNAPTGEPSSSVTLDVQRGVYSVSLGATSISNMVAIPPAVFAGDSLFLRIWFDDGVNGRELLSPDRPIRSVAFAVRAATAGTVEMLPEGLIEERHLPAALLNRLVTLESQVGNLSNATNLSAFTTVSTDPSDTNLTALGYEPFTTIPPPAWQNGSTAGEPSARTEHAAVWTGTAFVVWGGRNLGSAYLQSGAIYDAAANTWTAISPVDAPSPRSKPVGVWTGTQFIVWGGFRNPGGYLNTGGRYNPSTKQWQPTSTAGAPSARQGHVAVWTGQRLLIWGGRNTAGLLKDGALYDPALDQWTTLSVSSPPSERADAASVWTGTRLIVWGGQGNAGPLGDGAQLLFSGENPDTWTAINSTNAPSARTEPTLVWSGEKAILFGGRSGGALLGNGASYDPSANAWTPLPSAGAPSPRSGHVSVWTGTEALIVGGLTALGNTATGYAFRPSTGTWRTLTTAGSPLARSGARAAWTGQEILLFGGSSNGANVAALQRLNPQPTFYLYRKP